MIICTGNNKFSGTLLPDKSVLGRYEKSHIEIYRTDKDGGNKHSAETSKDIVLSLLTAICYVI